MWNALSQDSMKKRRISLEDWNKKNTWLKQKEKNITGMSFLCIWTNFHHVIFSMWAKGTFHFNCHGFVLSYIHIEHSIHVQEHAMLQMPVVFTLEKQVGASSSFPVWGHVRQLQLEDVKMSRLVQISWFQYESEMVWFIAY